jgi:uncharacterized protein (DUF1684 family)
MAHKPELTTDDAGWKYRAGEIRPIQFSYLSPERKEKYILQVLEIPEDSRSTYERVVIDMYKRDKEFRDGNSLVDKLLFGNTSTDTSSIILDDIEVPQVNVLMNFGKEYLEEYLNLFFENENSKWKLDLISTSTAEKFIQNTKNYMDVNELTIAHIHAYKKLI